MQNLNKTKVLIIGATSKIIEPFVSYLENSDKYYLCVTTRSIDTYIGGLNLFNVCDLSKKEDILKLVDLIKKENFDYIYYNASIVSDFNTDFNVNFYAFYLICECIKYTNTKIVLTSSISYLNINISNKKKTNNLLYNYRYTKKLALIYAYNSIKNNNQNIKILHPGLAYTKLFKKLHPNLWFIRPFLNSPKKIFKTFKYSLECKYDNKYMLSPGIFNVKVKRVKENKIKDEEYAEMKECLNNVNKRYT